MFVAVAALALTGNLMTGGQQSESDEHVRSSQPAVVALLRDGSARSETLARLILALNRSDVVAYIETTLTPPAGVVGFLANRVIVAGDRRYLRIVLDAGLAHDRFLCIMAHELQHAAE